MWRAAVLVTVGSAEGVASLIVTLTVYWPSVA